MAVEVIGNCFFYTHQRETCAFPKAQPQISEPWAFAIKDAIGRIRILHVSVTAAAVGAAVEWDHRCLGATMPNVD